LDESRIGNTSITTKVVVEVLRNGSERKLVTEAQVVYVNIGQDRKPKPITSSAPPASSPAAS